MQVKRWGIAATALGCVPLRAHAGWLGRVLRPHPARCRTLLRYPPRTSCAAVRKNALSRRNRNLERQTSCLRRNTSTRPFTAVGQPCR